VIKFGGRVSLAGERMKVKVSVSGPYAVNTQGTGEFFVNGDTALEVLKNAGNEYDKMFGKLFSDAASLSADVSVLINDKAATTLDSLKRRLRKGDVIYVSPAVSGGSEMRRRVYLNIPKDIVGQPLLFEVGHEFKVVPNIRGASISDDIGLVALELSGEEPELDKAIEWLVGKGVQVEQIGEPEVQN